MQICLDEMNLYDIPIEYDWRLNERHYGALQGLNKADAAENFGDKQVLKWRRSYDISPPQLDLNDPNHPKLDNKYVNLSISDLPSGECLKDTVKRFLPLWKRNIVPKILAGNKILIVAHGNSLRALVKHLENISDEDIIELNIPTGIPLVYELDIKLNPLNHYYLGDQDELKKRVALIADQGKSK